jgi:sugar lactone lactonase YvrE
MMTKAPTGGRIRWAVVFALVSISMWAGTSPADACEGKFLLKFGGDWAGAGKLSAPGDIAIDSKDNAWVLDTGHNRVQKFNSSGEFVLQFGSTGTGNSQFSSPTGIAVDSENDVWVASGGARVQEFSSEGAFKQTWSVPSMNSLGGIAIDPGGKVWIVGINTSSVVKVKKLTTAGESLLEFGENGTGNGQFGWGIGTPNSPQDIAADSEGNVLVADTRNHRVQEFNASGEFVRKYGSEGAGNGQFKSPQGLTVDAEGRVWVADTGNNRVQRFSSKGTYQAQLGSGGPNDGQFSEPQAVALDSSGNIWVADTGNNRVQKFECL